MLVGLHLRDRLPGQSSKHVCRFDTAAFDLGLIKRLDSIDKRAVPFVGRIEVWAVRPIDEDIDNVAEADEQIEMKITYEQWQNILRAYAFKTLCGVIRVGKFFF